MKFNKQIVPAFVLTFGATALITGANAQEQQDTETQQPYVQERDAAANAEGQQNGEQAGVRVEEQPAQVEMEQAAPKVTAEQQQMEVEVESGEPEVNVEQQEPEVSVEKPEPEISVDQAEPEVVVEDAEPQVDVNQAEPEVEVIGAEPEVEIVEQDAEGNLKDQQESQFQQQSQDRQNQEQQSIVQQNRQQGEQQSSQQQGLMNAQISELKSKAVQTSSGEELGSVDDVVASQQGNEAGFVVSVGGFFGLGDTQVFVPAEEANLQDDNIVWETSESKEQIEQSANFQEQEYYSITDRYNTLDEAQQSQVSARP